MSRTAYVNGLYLPLSSAVISIQDRAVQFADSIYEVWAVRGGVPADAEGHMARLRRSLSELRIDLRVSEPALWAIVRETLRRNRVRDGIVYLQVSRGAAPRDHGFPSPSVRPTLIVTAKSLDQRALAQRAEQGIRVITLPEQRWARADIKSTNLLPNVLARQAARDAGAFEAWYVDEEGLITEGTSSTAWIVDSAGRVRTPALTNRILHGVTRAALLSLARTQQMTVLEQAFTLAEAKTAREAFISAASNPAVPVIAIDGARVGDGRPGPVAKRLRTAYLGASSGA